MTESVEDLAAWLTQIWDEDSDPFEVPHATACNSVMGGESGWGLRKCDCEIPARWLARIAADRKILALHDVAWNAEVCTVCHHLTDDDLHIDNDPWPCATVRLLASPHADKPGFRLEWSVERQGVEW